MRKILLLGATGKLGRVVVDELLKNNYQVIALVRNPNKLNQDNSNLRVIKGDLTNNNDLKNALRGVDSVISVLGHGFRTKFPIQEMALSKLIPLMEKNRAKRIIAITGAGLRVKGDPRSTMADFSDWIFRLIDPYRVSDAQKQQNLLEKSSLEWTVIRTPVHNNNNSSKLVKIGYDQPMPWITVSRKAISKFMIECIEKNEWVKKSPIIY